MYRILTQAFIISLIYGYAYGNDRVVSETSQTILNSCEKNNYFNEKIQNGDVDFLKKAEIADESVLFLANEGSIHNGVLYVVLRDKQLAFRIETGQVEEIITSKSFAFLGSDEFIVIASTGGTGEHHVFGSRFKIENDNIKLKYHFPISGKSYQPTLLPAKFLDKGASFNIDYTIDNINFSNDSIKIDLSYKSKFEEVPEYEQAKILSEMKLKNNEEKAHIIIDQNKITINASDGVKERLNWLMGANDIVTLEKCK